MTKEVLKKTYTAYKGESSGEIRERLEVVENRHHSLPEGTEHIKSEQKINGGQER